MTKEFKMPSPADLAKKDSTVNISLRVKQSTADVFNMLAEKSGTKPGTMMINLLDAYADNYRRESGDNDEFSTEILKTYLNKTAEKIGKMDDSAIIRKFAQHKWLVDDFFETTGMDEAYWNIGTIEGILDDYKKGENTEDEIRLCTSGLGNNSYYEIDLSFAKKGEKPEFEEGDHQKGDIYFDVLYLPIEKWAATVLLLACYQDKSEEKETLFTEKMAHEIFDAAVKTKDQSEYMKKLAKILCDYIEEQND